MNLLLAVALLQDPWLEDAADAVAAAAERAVEENQRLLIVWGSGESEPCAALAKSLKSDAALKRALRYEYHVVYAHDSNAELAAKLGADLSGGVPLLTFVGHDGAAIAHARDTADLKKLLAEHQCAPQKADDVLAAALARAADAKRRVMLVFGAPW